MTKEVLKARIRFHTHRIKLWNLYKDIVKRHPDKYKIWYDHKNLSFHLLRRNRFGIWRPWAESQSWLSVIGNG